MKKKTACKSKNKSFSKDFILSLLKSIFIIFFVVSISVFGVVVVYLFKVSNDKIDFDMKATKLRLASVVYASDDGKNFSEYTRAYDMENRIWVDFKDIPKCMKDAIIAIEDKRFYNHPGVDFKRTVGAIFNMFTGHDSYGGSTITQQLIKNLTEENDVSITRKTKEIFRALNFEKNYSKDEILEAYLNMVNFGNSCRGVQAAANTYFGKKISDCSIAECAAIAGITQNPTAYNPFYNPENNKKRRETVIEEMFSQSKISQDEYNKAMDESSKMTFSNMLELNKNAGPVRDWYTEAMFNDIINDLSEKFGIGKSAASQMLFTQGLKIYSAIDKNAQSIAESVIEKSPSLAQDKSLELGYTMMDLNGRVLASIGSREKKTANSLFDRANFAKRQPGSSIKPIAVYAPAIDEGLYNYSSLIPDQPLENFYGKGKPGPGNWYGGYKGNVTLEWAIEQSANAPAVQALKRLTNRKSFDFLTNKLGFKNLDDMDLVSDPSLALGGMHGGVTVREMTAAFQIFGNGGVYNRPYMYYYVLDRKGKILLDNRSNGGKRAISSKTATIMNRLLRNAILNGTGKSANIDSWEVIGKTGTTNKNKDSWFVGLTPYAVSGIWTGYNTPKTLSSTAYAKTIWKEIMSKYLSNKPNKTFGLDSNVRQMQFCKNTGGLALPGTCSNVGTGYYADDNMPPACTEFGVVDFNMSDIYDINPDENIGGE